MAARPAARAKVRVPEPRLAPAARADRPDANRREFMSQCGQRPIVGARGDVCLRGRATAVDDRRG
jgi:hypothetical protein